jgi:hypothetical protein
MLALDQDICPRWLPPADHPALVEFGDGCAEIDVRIERWFANACSAAMAYRRSLQPQTATFARLLADFDRRHAATPEPRRRLVWRLPALSTAINRLLCGMHSDQAMFWRCYALHFDDFAELKASGFPHLPVQEEFPYALMAGSLLRAATDGEETACRP